MEKKLWKNVAELFTRMDAGIDEFLSSESLEAEEIIDNPDNNILQVRETIRKQLDLLRIDLADRLTEQESYYVLFAIVIYIDENIQTNVLDKAELRWPLLQKELFDIDDGGNLFYDTLDHILKKPEITLFVFEIFYFCLKHGFLGKHIDDPIIIADYKKSLEQKINTGDISSEIVIPEDNRSFPFLFSPAWYYGIAAFFIVLTFTGVWFFDSFFLAE
ncbi:MAG: DotU family type IV/VI secretion system protein [Desulfobacterales bacterium]|nr:DotU family type IV/VI secretion system protein [Desulfobacterales bacterium]